MLSFPIFTRLLLDLYPPQFSTPLMANSNCRKRKFSDPRRRNVPVQNFPENVIFNILTRLPTKTLISFMLVSKQWHSIIRDPHFTKSHFQYASNHHALSRRLLFSTDSQLLSFNFDTPLTHPPRSFDMELQDRMVLGSCNGLVCMAGTAKKWRGHRNVVIIWNPVTGLAQQLPCPSIFRSFADLYRGFGYTSEGDDSKILLGGYSDPEHNHDAPHASQETWLFSMRTRVWKRIKDGPRMRRTLRQCGALSNGAVHFMHDNAHNPGILAFDFGTEEFHVIPFPEFEVAEVDSDDEYDFELEIDGNVQRVHDLCVCEGYLYMIRSENGWENGCEIGCKPLGWWVMNEYRVAESWTKLFNLKLNPLPVPIKFLMPLVVRESGTTLAKLTYGKSKVVRIKNERERSLFEIEGFTYESDFVVYDETLLWLDHYLGVPVE